MLSHLFITNVLLKKIFCYVAQFKRQCFVHDTKLMTLADPYDEGMNFESDSIKSTFLIIYDLFVVYQVLCALVFVYFTLYPSLQWFSKEKLSVKRINHGGIRKTY